MYRNDEPSALFHALHHAHKRAAREEQRARELGDLGAPMLLLALLSAESRGETLSQRELARLLRLSPPTVAVSLKSVERDGYVTRTADERDARRNLVQLTEKGRRAVKLSGESFRAVDERMLSGFTEEEKAQLGGFLSRMIENLGGVEEPPFPPPPHGHGPHGGRHRRERPPKERDQS